jgi:hypothetical protein
VLMIVVTVMVLSIFHLEINQNKVFFKKKLFLISAHQNNPKT